MRSRWRGLSWWCWALTALALGAHLAGWPAGLPLGALLTALRGIHLAAGARRLTTLGVQVRAAYLGFLLCGAWPPLAPLLWPLLAGTLGLLVFDYCPLARTLSLLPWNRPAPLTLALIRAAYLTPPVEGSILAALVKSSPSGSDSLPLRGPSPRKGEGLG